MSRNNWCTIFRAGHEAKEWAEVHRRCRAYEVERRYQRLEGGVQPWSALEALDRAAQLRVNEVQTVDVDVIIAPGELGRYIRDGRQNAAELPEPWKDSY